MNWVQPIAPADEGPMLQPKPDSIWVIAAMICQRILNALPAAFQVALSGDAPEQRERYLKMAREYANKAGDAYAERRGRLGPKGGRPKRRRST